MNGKTFLFPIYHFRFTPFHHSRFMCLLVGVITGADQRSAGRVTKAHGQRFLFELVEARRLDVAQYRQVAARGLLYA